MIGNFNKDKYAGIKIVCTLLTMVIIGVWFITPPADKISQVCSWINNVFLTVTKNSNNPNAYIYERNNAVLTAKMYPDDKKTPIYIMDNLISSYPSNKSKAALYDLYNDRGDIKLFFGQYEAALQDFLTPENIKFSDYFKIALIYNQLGDAENAAKFCNVIVNKEPKSYIGYSCFSKIYEDQGKYDAAVGLWDLAIDDNRSNAHMRAERGRIKKIMGDISGSEQDYAKAKSINSRIKFNESIVENTIHPKKLNIPLKIEF